MQAEKRQNLVRSHLERAPVVGLHNGAAESLAAVVSDPNHRTANGTLVDVLTNAADQALLVKFLESIDVNTVPLGNLSVRVAGNQLFVAFESVTGASYALQAKTNLTDSWAATGITAVGTGQPMELPLPVNGASAFFRLVAGP